MRQQKLYVLVDKNEKTVVGVLPTRTLARQSRIPGVERIVELQLTAQQVALIKRATGGN